MEIVLENATLTGIVKWMNEEFKGCKKIKVNSTRKEHSEFTTSDVQQYIRFQHLPRYLGDYKIGKVANEYSKLYIVFTEDESEEE